MEYANVGDNLCHAFGNKGVVWLRKGRLPDYEMWEISMMVVVRRAGSYVSEYITLLNPQVAPVGFACGLMM